MKNGEIPIKLTLIFSGPNSQAPAFAKSLTPPFAAQTAVVFGAPTLPRIEEIITIICTYILAFQT